MIHSKSGAAVTIGQHTSIAHRSIVHGPCTVGDRVFIGFNSVLWNGGTVHLCEGKPIPGQFDTKVELDVKNAFRVKSLVDTMH